MSLSRITIAAVATLVVAAHASAQQKAKTVWPDEGPATWAPRPTVPDITPNDLRTRLYQFADDSMRGRKIGEVGNFKGTDYIAREFKRLGLTPAGENGTYFQIVPYGPARFAEATATLAVGGVALAPKTDWIPTAPTTTNRFAANADVSNVPTVFLGQWGDTLTALDTAMVRGKVAVFLAAQPARRGGPPAVPRCDSVPDQFGAAAVIANEAAQRNAPRGARQAQPGAVTARDTRAQSLGALGVLVIGLDAMQRNLVTTAFDPRVGPPPQTSTAGTSAGAVISRAAAERIFGKPVEQLAVGAAGQPVSASWKYEWTMSTTPGRNVIAVLPGSDPQRANEYVLVSAHNDHNGVNATPVDHDSVRAVNVVTRRQGANDPVCRPTAEQQHRIDSLIARARRIRPARADSINNGADDDGSGTVVLLEIAERFAKEKPARSIIFVSHTGEESGLTGSKWFTDHPTIPLASIVAAHNMDMVGKGRAEQVKFGGPNSLQMLGARRLSREFGDVIDSVNANSPLPMALDKSWDVPQNPLRRFCRSDQVNYVLHDLPVTYFSLGYAQDYHQVTDEPRYIDYDHAARVGRFIHDVMFAIANRPNRLAISGNDPSYPRCR